MPVSYNYDEARALAKQLRELTGRDIKHTQIIAAMSAVKGMNPDAMMHALKGGEHVGSTLQIAPYQREASKFYDDPDQLREVLKLEAARSGLTYSAVGVFQLQRQQNSSIHDLVVMADAIKAALLQVAADPRYVVGVADGRHFVLAVTNMLSAELTGPLIEEALLRIPRQAMDDEGKINRFRMVGSAAIVRDSNQVDEAIKACMDDIPAFIKRIPFHDKLHEWDLVKGWE